MKTIIADLTLTFIDTRRPRCHRRQLQVRRKIVLFHCAAALEPSPAYYPPEGVNWLLQDGA